jgi:hypothetical protein
MESVPPTGPSDRHGHKDALTTYRYRRRRDVGAADAAGDIVNRVVLAAAAKTRLAFAFAGRSHARTALVATPLPAPAPPRQRRRAA